MAHKLTFKTITTADAFDNFFRYSLDKKLQHADINELAKFVFGSIDKAIKQFEKERENWEA